MPAPPETSTTQVGRRIHRLGTQIVNWYLVEEDGRLTAVDSGLAGYADNLEDDVAATGHSLGDIEAVLLTHSDGDHAGMAAAMQDAGARVLIHGDDEATLRKPRPKSGDGSPIRMLTMARRPGFFRFMAHMARYGGAKHPPVGDVELFEDGDRLDVPGSPRVVHTPGHTDGHCVLHFESHAALFAGDELCTWNFLTGERGPRLMPKQTDVSYAQCVESLDRVEHVVAERVLPGHGDPWEGSPAKAAALARQAAR
jgi:glyoxylase-like metal-dependent hydrolase (beta-lactamase superfamily II)